MTVGIPLISDPGNCPRCIVLCSIALISFALSIYDLRKINWMSYLGNLFFLYVGLVVIAQAFSQVYADDSDFSAPPLHLASLNAHLFSSAGLCFFAFANQFGLITILKTLKENPPADSQSAIVRSQYLPLLLYSLVLVGGYFSFGPDMPHMLALREPREDSSDLAMTIGQVGLFVGISVAITIRIKSNADFIEGFVAPKYLTSLMRSAIKFGCAMCPLIIALAVEQKVLSLISTFASLLCPYFIIIVPGMHCAPSNFQVCST